MGTLDTVLSGVAALSPVIGTAIGGPAGSAIGLGVKALIQAITGTSDPQEAVTFLQANPDKLVELEQKTRELQVEVYKAQLADTQDARQQTIALAASNSAIAWGAPIVSTIILGGFFFAILALFNKTADMPPDVSQMLIGLFGSLTVLATQVGNYWLGSSKSSHDKDMLIAGKSRLPAGASPNAE